MKGIGEVVSTASFTLLMWWVYTRNGMAHNMFLLRYQLSILLQVERSPSLQPCTGALYTQWSLSSIFEIQGILHRGQ